MMLAVKYDNLVYDLDVPDALIKDAETFYAKMDSDMDKGWQVSRQWVDQPDKVQRCQIVADRILTAFHEEDERTILIMAGYILSRMPKTKELVIDTDGDITQTQISE